jgi:metal-responsive CopG/Arc/MetJ family transcriptional regulator
MARVSVFIEDGLLRAADRMAKKRRWSRSALFREAIQTFLKNELHRERQAQEREAYERLPDDLAEVNLWEGVAAWPEE